MQPSQHCNPHTWCNYAVACTVAPSPRLTLQVSVEDCELLADDLEKLVKSQLNGTCFLVVVVVCVCVLTPKAQETRYKAVVQLELGEEFPEDPKAQLWGAIGAVSGLSGPESD